MKRTVFWIFAFASLALPASADNEEIAGWHDAKWGMTPEEVQSTLKYTIRKADLSKVCSEKCEEGAALELEDYPLNDQHFLVRFWFAKDDAHLHTISMYAKGLKQNVDNDLFGKMKQFYERSYGSPSSVTLKNGYFITSWVLPATRITLYSNTANEMTVVYQEAKEGENGKDDISGFSTRWVPFSLDPSAPGKE